MKQSLAFVTVAAAALLAVAGCSNSHKPAKGTTTEIAPASQPPVAYVPPANATPDTTTTPVVAAEVNPTADAGATPRSSAAGTSTTHHKTSTSSKNKAVASAAGTTKITGKKYTVKKGDTLSEIVKAKYGTTKRMKEVLKANPGLDPDHIKVGQVITLP